MPSEHLRYRYGICLNDSCEKAKAKEIQCIPTRKEFECECCHKKLKETTPPKSFMQEYGKLLYVVIGVIVVVGVILAIVLAPKNVAEEEPIVEHVEASQEVATEFTAVQVLVDSVVVEEVTPVEEVIPDESVPVQETAPATQPKPQVATSVKATTGNGTLSLSYGRYTGDIKNGYPNGMGRLS